MALDGIYLFNLVKNLKTSIIDSKIDKINQPEKDEIILTLRKERKNIKLLISASSKFARIHLTDSVKKNPIVAPMYLMVLRKYILGGKIIDLTQKDGDRILIMKIENRDELGFDSIYSLIIEIMGRHSNITLVRDRDNIVMESIKHITPNINSYRVLYPGVEYINPPISHKLNPFSYTYENLNSFITNNAITLDKDFYFNCFTGISKILSNELYYNITKDNSSPTQSEIYENLKNFVDNISNNPSFIIFQDNEGYLKDYYCTKLTSSYSDYKAVNYNDPNILMDVFYAKKDKQDRLQNKSTDLQRLINTNIDRCNKKSNILKETLKECKKKEEYKIKGDLLTSYIYSIKKGDSECNLLNFYNENEEEYIKIALDNTKTPSENIQRYYKKYNKFKSSKEHAILELNKNNKEVEYLNSVLTNILNIESYDEIDEIKNELIETGYIRYKKKDKQKKSKLSKPNHFVSSDNIDIYVGKNNLQNDYLSLKFANKNHLWLHAKDIPGSHVIVCAFDVPDKTLEEAAIIAGFYSKGKNSNKLSVDYTKVRELKKPNGAKPGMVIYHKNNTIVIDPNDFVKLFNKIY